MPVQPAIVYLDIDRSGNGRYEYRRSHFDAAAALGWRGLALAEAGHEHLDRLARVCDEVVSLSAITVREIVNAVARLRARYDVKVLMAYPGQTVPGFDVSRVVEDACRELGLAHAPANAVRRCNNKFLMRKRLDSAGLANLAAELIQNESDLEEAASRIGFPLVFKPIFGAGSALIAKCGSRDALKAHYRLFQRVDGRTAPAFHGDDAHAFKTDDGREHLYKPGRTAMLEAYAEGMEATIECLVYRGEITPLLLQEKMLVTYGTSTVLEHLLIAPSASLAPAQIESAMNYCRDCVAATGLDRSFAHFEFLMTREGPRVIEINPRLGGFYVPRALRDLAGIDPFVTNLLLLSDDLVPETVARARETAAGPHDGHRAMFVVYPPETGLLTAVDGTARAAQRPGILEFKVATPSRRLERDIKEEYVAKYWGKAPSKEAALQLYRDVVADLNVTILAEAS